MKEGIHPNFVECTVTCGCGNSFVTRSMSATLSVEICSACHPFYTGKQKYVDTAGRVERFTKKHAWDEERQSEAAKAKKAKKAEIQFQPAAKLPPKKKGAALPEEIGDRPPMGDDRRGGGRGGRGPRGPRREGGAPPGASAPAGEASKPAAEKKPAPEKQPGGEKAAAAKEA
jgi:large subunit ribosomal protein L31